MKNGDMPAMAVKVVASVNSKRQAEALGQECSDVTFTGLSKREHFAAMAMQGILSSDCLNQGEGYTGKQISEIAVQAADSLLEALEQRK